MFNNEPLITYNCYEPLVDLIRNKCAPHLIGNKCKLILGQLLVPSRRLLLARLCTFLRDFSQHEATTKMNCAGLALCFANLMQPPREDDRQPTKKLKKKNKRVMSA